MLDIRKWTRENRGFLLFMAGLVVFRAGVADLNEVPSGSMRPTILEGDRIMVNRLAYDAKFPFTDIVLTKLGEPRRGDVVVFSSPRNGDRLVKRLVGLPGDVVEMRDKQLLLNGKALGYQPLGEAQEPAGGAHRFMEGLDQAHVVQWMDELASVPDYGPVTVPDGQYLMLGDNRDNSADSRYFGFVPRYLLNGKATGVLFSTQHLDRFFKLF